MVAVRQIFVLCLFMVLVNGSFFRHHNENVHGLRQLLPGLIYPNTNLRYHSHHLDRLQNSHLNPDELTRPDVDKNYIPSYGWEYGVFNPMSFYKQSFDSESQELEDNSLKSDLIEKDIQNIHNKNENTYSDYFPNANIDSHLKNEWKTRENVTRENVVVASQTDNGDSSDVNLTINPNQNITDLEQTVRLLFDQLLDSPDNNEDQYVENTKSIPSSLPFNYPPYLSNLFVPINSPIEVPVSNNVVKIPTTLNMLNNDAQYYHPKGILLNSIPNFNKRLLVAIVPNNNIMLPNPNVVAFTNVAIPNYANSGTNPRLDNANSVYNQNPYSDKQFLYKVELKNGQNMLNDQMYQQNNRRNPAQENVQRLISGNDVRMHVPSNSKYLPSTQNNVKGLVSKNEQHVAPNDVESQAVQGNTYENGQIIAPVNTQGVLIEDKNLVKFRNVYETLEATTDSSNSNSSLTSKDEQEASPSEDKTKKDDNDKLIFVSN